MFVLKKSLLLDKISNLDEGVNLSSICKLLDNRYNLRKVRFWVNDLIHDGLVIKNGLDHRAKFYTCQLDKKTAKKKISHYHPKLFKPSKRLSKLETPKWTIKQPSGKLYLESKSPKANQTQPYKLPQKLNVKFKMALKPTEKPTKKHNNLCLLHYLVLHTLSSKQTQDDHPELHFHIHDHMTSHKHHWDTVSEQLHTTTDHSTQDNLQHQPVYYQHSVLET